MVGNSKFECISGADDHDRTNLNEKVLQAFLLRQYKSNKISKSFYQRIPHTGSTRRRIYGLPKVHKPQPIPLRPIFSMIGSPQHQMANWLAEILQPVLDKYASHVIKDSFEFAIERCSQISHFYDAPRSTVGRTGRSGRRKIVYPHPLSVGTELQHPQTICEAGRRHLEKMNYGQTV